MQKRTILKIAAHKMLVLSLLALLHSTSIFAETETIYYKNASGITEATATVLEYDLIKKDALDDGIYYVTRNCTIDASTNSYITCSKITFVVADDASITVNKAFSLSEGGELSLTVGGEKSNFSGTGKILLKKGITANGDYLKGKINIWGGEITSNSIIGAGINDSNGKISITEGKVKFEGAGRCLSAYTVEINGANVSISSTGTSYVPDDEICGILAIDCDIQQGKVAIGTKDKPMSYAIYIGDVTGASGTLTISNNATVRMYTHNSVLMFGDGTNAKATVASNYTIDYGENSNSATTYTTSTSEETNLKSFNGVSLASYKYAKIYNSANEPTSYTAAAIRPMTINDTEKYYGTFYTDRNVKLPSGVKAYYAVKSENKNNVDLKEIEGSVITEGGYLLEAEESQSTITLNVTSESATTTPTKNLFKGDVETIIDNDGGYYYYILSGNKTTSASDKKVYGFYWNSTDGKSVKSNAFKAYLKVPEDCIELNSTKTTSARLNITLAGETTAISETVSETSLDNVIYDLQGRRLNGLPTKGLYIKNGKVYAAGKD